MTLAIFDLISELELRISELYGRMRKISRFKDVSDTFGLMEKLSYDHSEKIKKMIKKYTVASFDRNAVIKIHDRIKDKLWENVLNGEDENSIIKKMSDSEESVGKLYFAISSYYKKLSEYYNNISIEMEKIAKEEYDHRDTLLEFIDY